MSRLNLICHPATPCPVALDISVVLNTTKFEGEPQVQLDFEATGDVHRLRIPPTVAHPAQADGLWQHTCFEVFVASALGPRYQEFNFSPSGQWAHYQFASERLRDGQSRKQCPPRIAVSQSLASLKLCACLAVLKEDGVVPCGLSAVIELDDGSLSYWALHHPKANPDFHDRQGWTLPWPNGIA
jgi:hypothetical protein